MGAWASSSMSTAWTATTLFGSRRMPEALFSPPLTDREFEKFRRLAYERFGLSLTAPKRDLVAVRLGKRLREPKQPTFKAHHDHVLGGSTAEPRHALIDSP